MSKNLQLHREMAEAVAEVWVSDGLEGVKYRSVAEHTGKAVGNLQHFFPSAADVVRAGAEVLAEKGEPRWAEITKRQARAETLARAEAFIWLARNE